MNEAAKVANIKAQWIYVADIKIKMRGGESKTMMFFADESCPHVDVSWVERDKQDARAKATALAVEARAKGKLRARFTKGAGMRVQA